uniref:Uncharacterized protein n=1 Tax=Rhizophora mucronata TaxID=61149 RepID=A0A2P2QYE0_RHIMU
MRYEMVDYKAFSFPTSHGINSRKINRMKALNFWQICLLLVVVCSKFILPCISFSFPCDSLSFFSLEV